MKKLSRVFLAWFILAAMALISVAVYAEDGLMSVGTVVPGMKGIGKTVIAGTKIEQFDVEILGVLKGQSSTGDLVLVRVSGPLIDKSGGIAAGMSGSPVYINGQLLGAIGYGWGLTDHRMGMVTPIETMLKLFEMDKGRGTEEPTKLQFKNWREEEPFKKGTTSYLDSVGAAKEEVVLAQPIEVEGETYTAVRFYDTFASALAADREEGTFKAYPARTPIMVSGLSGRALTRLTKDLQRFDFMPVASGGAASQSANQPVEPGSAIAAQLVRGDIDISAIGTLTYEKDGQVLAFGHPFLATGPVEYYLSGAEVLSVVDSLDMPFKLGAPGEPQGVILQDRNAGIAGKLGQMPTIVPVEVIVKDRDLGQERSFNFQVVRDEELLVPLTINSVLQAFDTALDRVGYGTSSVEFEILGDRLPNNLVKFGNMYYSGDDIAGNSIYDIYSMLGLIMTNPFAKVNVGSIKVTMEVARERQVALIEEAEVLSKHLKPGDTAQVKVTLHPYRGEPFKQIFQVKIPENMIPGEAYLTVVSGQEDNPREEDGEAEGDAESANSSSKTGGTTEGEQYVASQHLMSLEEIIKEYTKWARNNELVIAISPYYSDSLDGTEGYDEGEDSEAVNDKRPKGSKVDTGVEKQRNTATASANSEPADEGNEVGTEPVREIFATEYVLEGSLEIRIVIEDPQAGLNPSTSGKSNQLKDGADGKKGK